MYQVLRFMHRIKCEDICGLLTLHRCHPEFLITALGPEYYNCQALPGDTPVRKSCNFSF